MNIKFENQDHVNGLMTITIEETDYADKVDKQLKDYRKKSNMPGFRPGAVPMGMIKKMYGLAVKSEVLNKVVSEQLYNYIKENNIQMLGEALPSDKQEPQDLKNETTHTFVFDIAVAPDFEINLSEKDTIDYYKIRIDDDLINRQVDMFASRSGSYIKAEEYAEGDMLKGDLKELNEKGDILDNGITVADAIIMPSYVKNEEQKKLFEGARPGGTVIVNPRLMYGDTELAAVLKTDKDEAVKHTGDFSYELKEITRYKKADIGQALFDSVYGQGTCADESAFRQKIAAGLAVQLKSDSDYKFLTDARARIEEQIGRLTFPDALLRRIMLNSSVDKDEEKIDKNYDASIKQLTWHLIKEKLVAKHNIKVEDDDIKATAIEAARVQFAQYGMNNVQEEYLENYAREMLKKRESMDGLIDRAIDIKLTEALKSVVKLNEKEVSFDEFNKLMEEK